MHFLEREFSDNIIPLIQPNKVVIVFGARRVGITLLIRNIITKLNDSYLDRLIVGKLDDQ